MTEKEEKRWSVKYSHDDGRSGTVECVTTVEKSGASQYGNQKAGTLMIGETSQEYDLRYCKDEDLHRVMLSDYFGKGLVEATEIKETKS